MPNNAETGAGPRTDAGGVRWRPPSPEEVGRAAFMVFEGGATDEAIARRLGVARRTLSRWKRRPEYRAARAALFHSWERQLEEERARRNARLMVR